MESESGRKHKREKCTNSGTFPWQKRGEAEGGLDLGDKLFFICYQLRFRIDCILI